MKRRLLIVSDSAFLDTGFGRVAREIGTRLQATGQFEVAQLGWFHQTTDKVVPFRIFPTNPGYPRDIYGELTFPKVVTEFQPDVVLAIGDVWMIRPLTRYRGFKLVGYVPIDSIPLPESWGETFESMDLVVAYTQFGADAIRKVAPNVDIAVIPHGVDVDTFKRLAEEDRQEIRKAFGEKRFVLGTVARNNPRKGLPRLIKTFRQFINPSTSCQACGFLDFKQVEQCPSCGGVDLVSFPSKEDTVLYMHTVPVEETGHDLPELVNRYDLNGSVAMPASQNLRPGVGVTDIALNRTYNSFDVFTLPTEGEGWGLTILEAMAVGVPVVVTQYSGHVEFVKNAGEFVRVSEFVTAPGSLGERAITDIMDHVMKLDRLYYEQADFIKKWGKHLEVSFGIPRDQLEKTMTGAQLRSHLGEKARRRAEGLGWPAIGEAWRLLLTSAFPAPVRPDESALKVEVAL